MAQLTNEERIEVNDGREMKVLMIVGSLRKNSFNKQLAAMAEQELGDRASVSVLDWSEVPVFNQDEEFPTPKSVAEARVAVNEADAIWIFATARRWHAVSAHRQSDDDERRGRSEHAAVRVRGVDALAHPVQNAHCAGAVHGRHTQPRDVQHR